MAANATQIQVVTENGNSVIYALGDDHIIYRGVVGQPIWATAGVINIDWQPANSALE